MPKSTMRCSADPNHRQALAAFTMLCRLARHHGDVALGQTKRRGYRHAWSLPGLFLAGGGRS